MKFGKVEDIANIDWKFPKWQHVPSSFDGGDLASLCLNIGCTGWSKPSWKSRYYPAKVKNTDMLSAYSKMHNTIECNVTHYQIPSVDTVQKWYQQTDADFIFCPKVLQTISHSKNLLNQVNKFEEQYQALSHLEEKLGTIFLQLPEHFHPKRWQELTAFIISIPKCHLFLEFRNPDWFKRDTWLWVCEFMEKHKIGLVLTDVSGRRDVLHQSLTVNNLFVRWVGNDDERTDYFRLKKWVRQISELYEEGLRNINFMVHQPDNEFSPNTAQYFFDEIKANLPIRGRCSFDFHQNNQRLSLF